MKGKWGKGESINPLSTQSLDLKHLLSNTLRIQYPVVKICKVNFFHHLFKENTLRNWKHAKQGEKKKKRCPAQRRTVGILGVTRQGFPCPRALLAHLPCPLLEMAEDLDFRDHRTQMPWCLALENPGYFFSHRFPFYW